jgi:hypothetical protein
MTQTTNELYELRIKQLKRERNRVSIIALILAALNLLIMAAFR